MNAMDLITGLHTSKSPAFKESQGNDETMRSLLNGMNVAGWIPIVGTITGIARLIFAAIMYNNDMKKSGFIDPESQAFYTTMILRGIVETLSLGFFFIITDLIFTIGREIANAPIKEMPPSKYKSFGQKHLYSYPAVTYPSNSSDYISKSEY